uniref:Fibrinogen C-terminal domain-containing protein n=1 Tax=Anopheles albimanus TaxID=7167 RepID=A0A182F402_ANOAL
MEKLGGGWIVVQHRFNGSVDFYRNWDRYRDGFGDLESEFWLGLEKMHQITKSRNYELVVEIKDFSGKYGYARYDGFQIGSESEEYRLKNLGSYSGTVAGHTESVELDGGNNPRQTVTEPVGSGLRGTLEELPKKHGTRGLTMSSRCRRPPFFGRNDNDDDDDDDDDENPRVRAKANSLLRKATHDGAWPRNISEGLVCGLASRFRKTERNGESATSTGITINNNHRTAKGSSKMATAKPICAIRRRMVVGSTVGSEEAGEKGEETLPGLLLVLLLGDGLGSFISKSSERTPFRVQGSQCSIRCRPQQQQQQIIEPSAS